MQMQELMTGQGGRDQRLIPHLWKEISSLKLANILISPQAGPHCIGTGMHSMSQRCNTSQRSIVCIEQTEAPAV